jgi:ABC-type spermidine/putrescine transport system permease subunit I
MDAMDAQALPEQLIAELNRRRNWKLAGALGGLVLALGVLFFAAMAMYSTDPLAEDRQHQLEQKQQALQPGAER